jgi:DNA-binding Lrp family transcriptional regulator
MSSDGMASDQTIQLAQRRRPTPAPESGTTFELSELDRRLLDEFQRDLPICARPYEAMAKRLGCDEQMVLERLTRLEERGFVSRVGPVFRVNCLGASTLAAMAVPAERLHGVAKLVSSYAQVNHNYEREHEFNLWFVVTASDAQEVTDVLSDVRRRTRLPVMDLPLTEAFHIDLGFPLWTS